MFGKKPCLKIRKNRFKKLIFALNKAGYRERFVEFKRDGEIAAYGRELKDQTRVIHLRLIDAGRYIEIFAHTEVDWRDDAMEHFLRRANYGAGCRVLKSDLKKVGFRTY